MSDDRQEKLAKLLSKAKGTVLTGSDWSQRPGQRNEPAKTVHLDDMVPGRVVEWGDAQCLQVRQSLRAIWPESSEIMDHYHRAVYGSGQSPDDSPQTDALTRLIESPSADVIYLDIETCGFSGTPIFLIGWCYYDGEGDFIVEQALARDYSEEAGILRAAQQRLRNARVLVTYNGKRFDLPSICERGIIHRTTISSPAVHIDLLDHARNRWRWCLPNCQLQTLEKCLCQRSRTGDIPGSQIPQVYHDFVRTGDARRLVMVMRHNLLDVVTLAQVAAHLIAGTGPGE